MPYNVTNLNLPSVADLFSSQEEREDAAKEKVEEIALSDIGEFPNHPFQIREDEEMQKMVASIRQYGVLNPVIVRPNEKGRYEMVSGHRRKRSCELAGIETIPCLIRDMTRDEAIIYMVDSNMQREHVLPSEKAMAFKMKLEALNRQGSRTDLASVQVGQRLKGSISRDIVAQQSGESSVQVQRYIRLTELIPEMLSMVDAKKIAFNPAVELSYLGHDLQRTLYDIMEEKECTPSLSQAQRLKSAAQEERLDRNGISLVLSEEKPQQKESFSFSAEQSRTLFPQGYSPVQKQQHIEKALNYYNRYLERKRSEPVR